VWAIDPSVSDDLSFSYGRRLFNLLLAHWLGAWGILKISIFALSTFDTDYILVRSDKLEKARRVLQEAGHHFI
jgi:hypothetical protein